MLADIFGSLGQSTRLDVIRVLAPVSKGGEASGLPAGQIAAVLGVAPPTLSFHLKDMTLRNLITQRRQGREIIYVANLPFILSALSEFVSEIEV